MKIETLIKTLVDEAIAYYDSNDTGNSSMESFVDYLRKKDVSAPSKRILKLPEHHLDQEIIVHVGRLNRFAHAYLKRSLASTLFSTDMDFAFTAILHQYGSMKKMDLVRKLVYEKSSGMEIIKRLIRTKLIEQTDHPEDKRSKLLRLTSKGEAEILAAYEKAGPAAKTVSLPLSEREKKTLLGLLSKLDDFHLEHYLDGESDPVKIIGNNKNASDT